jgi:hypothetical protein
MNKDILFSLWYDSLEGTKSQGFAYKAWCAGWSAAQKESTLQEISDIGQKAHTDHPMRHWDRTCPACVAEAEPQRPVKSYTGGEPQYATKNELDIADRAYFAGKQAGAAEAVKREWVSLSDDDTEALIEDLAEWSRYVEVDTAPHSLTDHVRQVLAKLREKNT